MASSSDSATQNSDPPGDGTATQVHDEPIAKPWPNADDYNILDDDYVIDYGLSDDDADEVVTALTDVDGRVYYVARGCATQEEFDTMMNQPDDDAYDIDYGLDSPHSEEASVTNPADPVSESESGSHESDPLDNSNTLAAEEKQPEPSHITETDHMPTKKRRL
jgi:hypothetical protein